MEISGKLSYQRSDIIIIVTCESESKILLSGGKFVSAVSFLKVKKYMVSNVEI